MEWLSLVNVIMAHKLCSVLFEDGFLRLPCCGYAQAVFFVLHPELQCFISDYQLTRDAALHHGPQEWTSSSTGGKHRQSKVFTFVTIRVCKQEGDKVYGTVLFFFL